MASPDEHGRVSRGRPAKVGHRKSRNGCLKCKARRVKCDEVQPICGNCSRLHLNCAWPDEPLSRAHHNLRVHRTTRQHSTLFLDPAASTRSGPSPSPIPSSRPSPSTLDASASSALDSPEQAGSTFMAYWPHWAKDENPFSDIDTSQEISLPETKARRMVRFKCFITLVAPMVAHADPFTA